MPRLTAGNTIVARYVVNALETSPHVESEQWQATDKIFGRDVYLYVIDSSVPAGAIDRARASAQLTVEGLARVIDVVDKGGSEKYIITERPAGVTTANAIAAAPFTLKQTKAVIGSVASSLAKADSGHGLYHGALTADSIYFKGLKVTLAGLVPRNFLGLNLDKSPEELASTDAKGLAALSYFMLTGLMSNYLSSEVSSLPRLADFLTDADGDVDAFTTNILNSEDSPVRSAQEFLDVLGQWSPDDLPFVDEDSVNAAPKTDSVPLPPPTPSAPQRKSSRTTGATVPGTAPVAKPAFGAVGALGAAGAGGLAGTGSAAGEAGAACSSSAVGAASETGTAASASESTDSATSEATRKDASTPTDASTPAVSEFDGAFAQDDDTSTKTNPTFPEGKSDLPEQGIVGKPEDNTEASSETQAHDLSALATTAAVSAAGTADAADTAVAPAVLLGAGGPPRFMPTTSDRSLNQPLDARPGPAYGAFAPMNSASSAASNGSTQSSGSPSWPTAPVNEKTKLTGFSATPWVLVFFLALLGLGGFWALNALTAPTEPAIVAPTGRPVTVEPDSENTTQKPEEVVIPVVKSAKSLDPMGDNNEHPELQDRLIDGDTTSEWYSRTYKTKAFGGIKKDGIGFALQLETEATVNSLLISSQNTGGKVEIRATSADDPAGGELLASGKMDGETMFKFSKPAKTDSIVVWFTEMPKDSRGKFRIYVYEASLA